jgi:pyruvate dehydrogenase E2 component (dihydrolipoamide acetyltransferase)
MGEFLMPSLGADMDSGTVLEWRVRPGDTVHRGDIVAVVDTDKSTIDVEVFEDGVITELLVEPGTEVPVGTVLAHIGAASGASLAAPSGPEAPAVAKAAPPAATTAAPAGRTRRRPANAEAAPARRRPAHAEAAPARRRAPAPKRAHRATAHVRASPLARVLAAERGLALEDIAGSGPGGAVIAADVDRAGAPAPTAARGRTRGGSAAAPRPVAPPAPGPSPPPAVPRADRRESLRRAIAALMARSKREIPHYYVATTIDLSATMAWLRSTNEGRPPAERLLPAALLLKASALAAREVPALNGFWDEDDGFRPSDPVHLGVAVSLRGGGLVAPAIHDADRLTVVALMGALRDVVTRARSGRLRSSEMADPTITVTNLGDQGADEVHGVIYPPQVALVGFGRIAERPWAQDGMLGVRPTVRATVAADHRASDGLVGARFLAALDRLLQNPEEL